MNHKIHQQTLARLQQLGLIDANITTANIVDQADYDDTPWFLQLLLGFSGFVASFFFIGFLSLILKEIGVLDNFITSFIIGLLLSGVGFALFKNKRMRRSTFLISLAFAISVAGQAYIVYALFISDISHPLNVWLFLLVQIVMTIIMPNFIYRLLSAAVALGCIVYLLGYYQASEASLALLALITIVANLQRYPLLQSVPAKWRLGAFELSKAITYASAFMLLIFSIYVVAGEYTNSFIYGYESYEGYQEFRYDYILAQVLLVLASLYAIYLILQRYNIKLLAPSSLIIACAIIVLGIISVYVSGLLAASLVIIIAMANSQRILLALGVLALVSYIFWYYYQLDTSLLIKSASMLIIGIIMLLMRWLLISRYFAEKTDSKEGSL